MVQCVTSYGNVHVGNLRTYSWQAPFFQDLLAVVHFVSQRMHSTLRQMRRRERERERMRERKKERQREEEIERETERRREKQRERDR